ncbi:transcriptional regulator [Candidatus Campbellbacteria bacterium]|nr:MAG: transcriptional regulator [Candidatus Campbellbacteria bacterium]
MTQKKNTRKNKKKDEIDFEKYRIDENFYDVSAFLDDQLGKEGTKKRERFRRRALLTFQLEELMKQRKEAGLSQQEVADKMDVTKSYISKIENGKINPSVSTFYRYVEAIGKRVEIV